MIVSTFSPNNSLTATTNINCVVLPYVALPSVDDLSKKSTLQLLVISAVNSVISLSTIPISIG